MTHNPGMRNKFNLRKRTYYNVKDEGLGNFWGYCKRVKKVWIEMGIENRVAVMNCMSGCDGNWVQVRFYHKYLAGKEQTMESMPEFEKRYDDILRD